MAVIPKVPSVPVLETVSWPGALNCCARARVSAGRQPQRPRNACHGAEPERPLPGQKFVFLVSIMADKDVDQMLSLLAPLAVRFVTVAARAPCLRKPWQNTSAPMAAGAGSGSFH